MSAFSFTPASARSTVVRYQDASDAATHRFAGALAFLASTDRGTERMSVRDLVAVAADLARPVGRNRISVLVRAYNANTDATTEAFVATLADLTRANRGESTPAADDTAAESTGDATTADLEAPMSYADRFAVLATLAGDDDGFRTAVLAYAATLTAPVAVKVPRRTRTAA